MSASVCLLTDSLEPSGLGEHMLALAGELRGRYAISFVCPPTPAGSTLLARAAALGLDAQPFAVQEPGVEYGRLVRWLGQRRPDLLHVHAGIGWEGHAACRAGRDAGVPVVLRTEHLPDVITSPRQRAEYGDAAALVDCIVCVSRAARDSFVETGLPATKLRVVRNGIVPRPPTADRTSIRDRLGLRPGAPLVLTVGRMTEQKGHRYLADAVPSVAAHIPEATFLWAGDGPLADDLRLHVERLGAAGSVRFAGRRHDVPDLMLAADLFVLPSLFEGLPLVALEAMAAGLPVVGTRVCGTAEVVVDGVTGRLVEPRDGAALAGAIVETVSRPEVAARWGEAGRRRVEAAFTAARMARETAALYDELLRARRGRAYGASRAAAVARVDSAGPGSRLQPAASD